MSEGPPAFLSGPSEMAGRMRAFDWASHPLGPPSRWPTPLAVLLDLMLGSDQPMFIAWGPERILLYNDGYGGMLGLRHPAALGEPVHEVWHDIADAITPILDAAYVGRSTYMQDIAFTMTRNGYPEETHFSFSYNPVRDGDGIGGMFCAATETTSEVVQTRTRLEEAESLRRLFDQAPSFMCLQRGPGHVFEIANAAFQKLVGDRDLVGLTVREAFPDIARQGFYELLDQVYASGQPFVGRSIPVTFSYRAGEPATDRVIDFIYQPVLGEDGQVDGIFTEGHDVTDRHTAEAKLRESEERFRLIADSAPVPMWVTKLDRTRSFVNRAYIEFLGIAEADAATFDWRTILHPDDHDRIVAESIAGEASLKPFTLLARYHRGDGTWRWIESASQPRWGPGGEHEGFIGVAHDVTEAKEAERTLRGSNESLEKRVDERTSDLVAALDRLQAEVGERLRAEEALRQAQKMEAVGQLTGGIAHDFNNLLTPIMGGLSIIARSLDDPRLKRMAEAGLEAARRGAKLSGQLLAFSRIQRISMAPVDVNAVITAMHDLLQQTLEKRIEVSIRLDPEVGHGLCDANQLENAILNLAINARDAIHARGNGGGTLTIATDRVALAGEPDVADGDYVRITIADTGVGMEPDVLRRATEPFFSTKPVGKGTGLGLAQVYGIANQSGGTLRIESAAGEGSTIDILLPWTAEPAAPAAVEAIASARRASAARLLVVDDDPDVRLFLSEALSGLGYRVTTAASGAAALATIAASAPDLVLIDFAMPGMSGADAARSIRETRPGLPIIFVTGFAETQQLEAALGAEAPVLRKPFGIAALAAVVESNLPIDA